MKDLPEKIDSKFRYVLLAATRAEQLMKGAMPKDPSPDSNKHTTIGMDEIATEMIAWDYGPGEEPAPLEVADEVPEETAEASGAEG